MMNLKVLLEMSRNGVKPVVQFSKGIEEMETIIDGGMRGRFIGFVEQNDGCIKLRFEIKEFEAFNVPLMQANYFDKDGNPTQRAIDTNYYPKDGVEEIFWTLDTQIPLEIIDENTLFQEYVAIGSEKSYVLWLENQLLSQKRAWIDLKDSLGKDVTALKELKEEKTAESEHIRLGGKVEGVTHTLERIRTTGIHFSI